MLNVYVKGLIEPPVDLQQVDNVEAEALKVNISKAPLFATFLHEIEQGKPLDLDRFIDRFGVAIYHSSMSTGCKAAICVASLPDKVINLIECGPNAIESILCNCTEGHILLHDRNCDLSSNYSKSVDICFNGYRFTDPCAFCQYISEDIEDGLDREPSYKGGWERV